MYAFKYGGIICIGFVANCSSITKVCRISHAKGFKFEIAQVDEPLKDYDFTILYHLDKSDMVVDDLSKEN